MNTLSAQRTQFSFQILGMAYETRVVEFTVDEHVSAPYRADLLLACEDDISLSEVVGKEGLLTIPSAEADRKVHGVISRFAQVGKSGRFTLYEARLVPQIWLLSQSQDSRLFQNESVQDIVKAVFNDQGIPGDRLLFRLQESYPAKEYAVQYQETDLGFVSRLMEWDGIWYFFEQGQDKHRVVFADGRSAYKPIKGNQALAFRSGAGMVPSEEVVYQFRYAKNIGPGKVSLTDYNYQAPSLPLGAQEAAKTNQSLEIYEHPGGYDDAQVGQNLAKRRLQEKTEMQETAEGASTCPRLSPGYTFALQGHDTRAFNQDYLLVSVTHRGTQPQVLEETSGQGAATYSNEFTVLPAAVTYRPPRKTPKPVILGPQTATVVGPEGEEIYTDELGRVKVKFHWDRGAAKDEKSSCWIRVSQLWAGEGWGAMFIPRKGQEVIVSFMDGDPDRPIITGRVYNGATPLPHAFPANKTKSTIMSQTSQGGKGSNELSFEDAKGREDVYLHGQKDLTVKIEHDKNQTVGNDETLTIGKNRSQQIGQNQSATIGGSKVETVVMASAENVGLAKVTNVGADYSINVGAAHTITVGGVMNTAVGLAQVEEVGLSKNTIVGQDFNTTVKKDHVLDVTGSSDTIIGKSCRIHVADSFEVVCGQSSFRMEQDGTVTLTGKEFKIAASGSVKINGQAVDIN